MTTLIIPEALLEGAKLVRHFEPERVVCENSPARTTMIGQGATLSRMVASMGALGGGLGSLSAKQLLKEGLPVSEPMQFMMTRLERDDGVTVVICSELADNTGTSVTNAWPGLANYLCDTYGFNPLKTVFVEHYGEFSYHRSQPREPDRFDHVQLDWRSGDARLIGWKPFRLSSAYGAPAAMR